MIMCVSINSQTKDFLCFDHSQYEKEIALFHEMKEKLLKKVEKNESKLVLLDKGNSFQQFKDSLKNIDHQNLKP